MVDKSNIVSLDRSEPESENLTTDNPTGEPVGEARESQEPEGSPATPSDDKAPEDDQGPEKKPWAKYGLWGLGGVMGLGMLATITVILTTPNGSGNGWQDVDAEDKTLSFSQSSASQPSETDPGQQAGTTQDKPAPTVSEADPPAQDQSPAIEGQPESAESDSIALGESSQGENPGGASVGEPPSLLKRGETAPSQQAAEGANVGTGDNTVARAPNTTVESEAGGPTPMREPSSQQPGTSDPASPGASNDSATASAVSAAVNSAEQTAESLGLDSKTAAAYVARERAKAVAKDRGYSDPKTKALVAYEQAKAKALASGKSLDQARADAASAAREVLDKQGISRTAQQALVQSIASDSGATPIVTASNTLPGSGDKQDPVQAAVEKAKRYANDQNMSRSDAAAYVARARAKAQAQQRGLSDSQTEALMAHHQAKAQSLAEGKSFQEATRDGDRAAEARLSAIGVPQQDHGAAIDTALSAASSPANEQIQAAIQKAAANLNDRQMRPATRAAFLARARAQSIADARGMSSDQKEALVAYGQAEAQALARGRTPQQAEMIAREAASRRLQALGVDSSQYNMITDQALAMSMETQSSEPVAGSVQTPANPPSTGTAYSGNLEQRVANLESQSAQISQQLTSILSRVDQSIAQNNRSEQRNSESLKALRQAMESGLAAVKQRVADLEKISQELSETTGDLDKNFGWISNRTCRAEAAAGLFNNPRACSKIYAEYRQPKPSSEKTAKAPPQQKARNPEPSANTERASNTYSAIPETTKTPAGKGNANLYASLPATETAAASPTHVTGEACQNAVDSWRFVTISERMARIVNKWGAPKRVVMDSYIPELGAVIDFQVKRPPRFVVFENGIVCR